MQPRRVYANARVRADLGKVAVMRGPVVYCLEQADNGPLVEALCLPRESELICEYLPDKLGGITEIRAAGKRLVSAGDALYSDEAPVLEDAALTFIPYYAWANRGENEMTVYVRDI